MQHNIDSQKNRLKLKGDQGYLPDKEFRYGKESGVLTSMHAKEQFDWQYHQASQNENRYKDFKKFNKMCVSRSLVKNKEIKQLQKSVDYSSTNKRATGNISYNLPDDEFIYGLRYKPSTPITNVMQNVYHLIAEKEIEKMYKNHQQRAIMNKNERIRLTNLKSNNNQNHSKISHNSNNQSFQSSFILPQFQNVKSKINSINQNSQKQKEYFQSNQQDQNQLNLNQ